MKAMKIFIMIVLILWSEKVFIAPSPYGYFCGKKPVRVVEVTRKHQADIIIRQTVDGCHHSGLIIFIERERPALYPNSLKIYFDLKRGDI